MRRLVVFLLIGVLISVPLIHRRVGVSTISVSAQDSDKRRIVTVIKKYMPEEMIQTIFSDDIHIIYKPFIKSDDGMCIAGYVQGNKIVLVEDADLVTILHEFTHMYDSKMGYSDTKRFSALYDKYRDVVTFRFRTEEQDMKYISQSIQEFFAETYAYYLVGDLKCEEMEEYFENLE